MPFGRDVLSKNANDNTFLSLDDPVHSLNGQNKSLTALGSHKVSGPLAGVQLGCDYQVQQHFVVGLQGDFSWANLRGLNSLFDTYNPTLNSRVNRSFTGNTDIDLMGTITGRVGYSSERALFYVKGGAAWIHDNYSMRYDRASVALVNPPPPIVFQDSVIGSASATRWGWTVGTGFEYALSKHVSAFVEYDFLDFGTRAVKFSCTASGNSNACSAPFSAPSLNINEQMNQVKLGLNVRF